MELETARWLTSEAALAALDAAASETDPGSLPAAQRLRRLVSAAEAAAVLTQASLRARARSRFGEAGARLFWTPDALEQATRPAVSAWRAGRLVDAGASRVVDLGCGAGLDSLAFAQAGLAVTAVERDPVTAEFARANLVGLDAEVVLGDAVEVAARLLGPGDAVFIDPARRTARGRSWDLADLSPSWEFAVGLLDGSRPVCVKLGPGLAPDQVPDGVEGVWVSESGDLVEASLWAGVGAGAGTSAVLLPSGASLAGRVGDDPVAGALAKYVVEPDPAVIRAGATAELARRLDAHAVAPRIAYLTADTPAASPFATCFEVLEVLPYRVKDLRAWVAAHDIGTLEIKKRGIDVDPAQLRRDLRPRGTGSATLLLTPTPAGAVALVVRRWSQEVTS